MSIPRMIMTKQGNGHPRMGMTMSKPTNSDRQIASSVERSGSRWPTAAREGRDKEGHQCAARKDCPISGGKHDQEQGVTIQRMGMTGEREWASNGGHDQEREWASNG